jgi:hypothetical protein
METKFQTSFIPKKPIVTDAPRRVPSSTSLLFLLGLIAFIGSVGWAVGTFFMIQYYNQEQQHYKTDLAENEKRYSTPLIAELARAKNKIDVAKTLLQNHVAVSEALTIVAALTAEKVHFTDFTITAPAVATNAAPDAKSTYKIQMKGVADGFNSIAFQSDVFGRSQKYGTNKVLKNPILSDLSVDVDGDVKFNFTAEILPDDISYEKVLSQTSPSEGSLPSPGATN